MTRSLFVLFTLKLAIAFSQAPVTAKVGYADVGYIVSKLPEFKDIQDQYSEAENKYKTEIQLRGQEFQKQYQDYVSKAQTMSDTARASAEQKLQEAQASIQNLQNEAQHSLGNFQKLLLAPLYLAVNSTIRQVAQESGFSIILSGKIGESRLTLFQESKFDISELVIKKLTQPANEAPPVPQKTPPKKN